MGGKGVGVAEVRIERIAALVSVFERGVCPHCQTQDGKWYSQESPDCTHPYHEYHGAEAIAGVAELKVRLMERQAPGQGEMAHEAYRGQLGASEGVLLAGWMQGVCPTCHSQDGRQFLSLAIDLGLPYNGEAHMADCSDTYHAVREVARQ